MQSTARSSPDGCGSSRCTSLSRRGSISRASAGVRASSASGVRACQDCSMSAGRRASTSSTCASRRQHSSTAPPAAACAQTVGEPRRLPVSPRVLPCRSRDSTSDGGGAGSGDVGRRASLIVLAASSTAAALLLAAPSPSSSAAAASERSTSPRSTTAKASGGSVPAESGSPRLLAFASIGARGLTITSVARRQSERSSGGESGAKRGSSASCEACSCPSDSRSPTSSMRSVFW